MILQFTLNDLFSVHLPFSCCMLFFLNPVNCALMCLANVSIGNGRPYSGTENIATDQEHMGLQAAHMWMC